LKFLLTSPVIRSVFGAKKEMKREVTMSSNSAAVQTPTVDRWESFKTSAKETYSNNLDRVFGRVWSKVDLREKLALKADDSKTVTFAKIFFGTLATIVFAIPAFLNYAWERVSARCCGDTNKIPAGVAKTAEKKLTEVAEEEAEVAKKSAADAQEAASRAEDAAGTADAAATTAAEIEKAAEK
jgi:hypothetical protein